MQLAGSQIFWHYAGIVQLLIVVKIVQTGVGTFLVRLL